MILTPLQKLPKNVKDLGKLIVAKGFKKLPKVQKIAQSGHTAFEGRCLANIFGVKTCNGLGRRNAAIGPVANLSNASTIVNCDVGR